MSTRVDYDTIAPLYDDRRRDYAADARLAVFLDEHGAAPEDVRVLDVGCGTGKQLAADRHRYPRMRLTGIDRSNGMLGVARTRDATVQWVQGDAQQLPFAAGVFDYATNQFSYPHIGDKAALFTEVFRVLRPGGRFVLTNIDPWAMRGWALYRYFPESLALDERDFLPVATLTALLAGAGFRRVETVSIDRSHRQDLEGLLASVSKRHSASQLIAIADDAYHAGVNRVRGDLARGVTGVESPFVVVTVQADKPA